MKNKKIAFLDRDGVINKKAAEHAYITKISDFVFNEGIFELVKRLRDSGFEFIVVTNQRGIARGLYSEERLLEIHDYMRASLSEHSIDILDVFYCPHENDVCECRKPKDGLLRQACAKYSIDLPASILISDSPAEVQMGKDFGIGNNILIPSDEVEKAFDSLH